MTFSVIVPVYNTEAYLAQCLDSVLDQGAEVIVVNDGSPGPIAETIKPYLGRVKYIDQKNAGVNAARNHGAREATGDFLIFLDSDDYFLPGVFSTYQTFLKEHADTEVMYSGFYWANASGEIESEVGISRFETSPLEVLVNRCIAPIMAVAIRKELFQRLGGFDETMTTCEDWDLWMRAAIADAKFRCVAPSYGVYRKTPGSLSHQFMKMWQGILNLHRKHRDALSKKGIKKAEYNASIDHFLDRYLPALYGDDLHLSWTKRRVNRIKTATPHLTNSALAFHLARRMLRKLFLRR